MRMDCPADWRDKSMLILSAGKAGASGVVPNMVVTRDTLPADLPAGPNARMTALLDRQVEQMQAQLAGFSEISRRIGSDAAHPTAEIRVDWNSPQAGPAPSGWRSGSVSLAGASPGLPAGETFDRLFPPAPAAEAEA